MTAEARVIRDGIALYRIYVHRKGYPNSHLAPRNYDGDRFWLAFSQRHAFWKARRKLARYERQAARRSQSWAVSQRAGQRGPDEGSDRG